MRAILALFMALALASPAIAQSTSPSQQPPVPGNGASTGSGAVVLATSPTLVTPALGTPSAVVLTNATGLPCGTGIISGGLCNPEFTAVNIGNTGDLGSVALPAGNWVINGGAMVYASNGATGTVTGTVRTAASGGGAAILTFTSAAPPASGTVAAGGTPATTTIVSGTLYYNQSATTATGTASVVLYMRALPGFLMRLTVALCAALLATPAYAADPWAALPQPFQPSDGAVWTYEIAYQTLNVVDWGQTDDIADHPDVYETNPLLGKHPSRTHIAEFKIGMGVGHAAITALLLRANAPRPIIFMWEAASIGSQGYGDVNNYTLGLRARIRF